MSQEMATHSEPLLSLQDAVRGVRVASMASCVFNLANTMVGSGMLGLPAAFSNAGSVLGCVLLLGACGRAPSKECGSLHRRPSRSCTRATISSASSTESVELP